MESALRIAIGVSIIAHKRVDSGAPAFRNSLAAIMMSPGVDTFGMSTAAGATAAAAIMSARPHSVDNALTRMTISRAP